MQVKFTDRYIRSIKLTSSGQRNYVDKSFMGEGTFGLKVGKSKRSWYISFSKGGKRHSRTLGQYPQISLADARKAAGEQLNSPVISKEQPTVDILWTEYLKGLSRQKKQKTPRTLKEEQRKYDKEIKPAIGHLKVADVTPHTLATFLDKIADDRPVQANRFYSLLSVMFKPALRLGWIDSHPLQHIDKPGGTEVARKRILTDDEIKTLWPYFDKLRSNPKDMLKLGLLTAQRPGEIAAMKWEDLDLEEQVWTQHDTKNGSVHLTPLVDASYNILMARWNGQTEGWVFPSIHNRVKGAVDGRSRDTKSARQRVQRDSGITGWTAHDLRRTARTLMSRLKIKQHIRERVLNHSQGGIVGVYDQYDYLDEKKSALTLLAREIESILR